MDLFDQAAAGIRQIDAEATLKDRALTNLRQWLTADDFAAYRPQIDWLIRGQKWSLLLDSFYQVLPFGTGGRRGAVGIGPNRMNLWTLGASVQGHCEYLREKFPGVKDLHVVLGYDVRRFEDQRKNYNPELPNPVLGLSSRMFAQHAAGVYAANGAHAHILPPDSPRYLATPELSFAIRSLKAHGGLNVSASHNPPDDNGGKFYDERGGQPVPPDDQIMSDLVDQVTLIKELPWPEAQRSGKVHWLTDEPHAAYIDLCCKQSLIAPPKFDEFRVVFTPLQGVGGMTAMEVLTKQGFRPIPVPGQMEPDGQFPNVTGTPNPENAACLDRAAAAAREHQADLALATDPDADRVGGVSREEDGGYRLMTGNEICALVTHFKLSQLSKQGRLPASPIVVTTEVTTTLVTRIARQFGAQVINHLLVGFKYIADVLWQLEQAGRFEDVTGTPDDFVLGTEESHGVMAMPQVRDKDAAAACLLLAEVALDQKRQGRTVGRYLADLARQFGYFRNELVNVAMAGIEGKQLMARMLDRLRADPPRSVGGFAVERFEDLRDEDGRFGPLQGATDAAGRNVLVFRLADGDLTGKVSLRPSGTEPKAKAYIEVATGPCPPGESAARWAARCRDVDARTQRLADDFVRLALGLVGQKPPEGGVKLSR
jgi:phosphoglucomutase/phosphomannomutase